MTSYAKTAANLGSLSSSSRYKHNLERVQQALDASEQQQALDNDLINDCNEALQQIDEEVFSTYRFVAETYAEKFPELEALLANRSAYIQAVQRIANEVDVSSLSLSDILSAKQIMLVSVSISTTAGRPLSAEKLSYVLRACEEIARLETDRARLLSFLERSMGRVAPNLSALIGSHLTAQLLSVTGGLEGLCKVPACNIQVLGQERRALLGLSAHSSLSHAGLLSRCDLVEMAPPDLKKKVVKSVAAKVALAGRVDLSLLLSHPLDAPRTHNNLDNSSPLLVNDNEGQRLRRELLEKMEKLQEPPKARTKKALPVPEERKKPRRGGKRMRRLKERFAQTDLQKAANRVTFDPLAGEYGDSAMGVDGIASGLRDSQKLRAPRKTDSQFLKKARKAVTAASSGQSSGLSSSLVFTPVQGLELVDPNAAQQRVLEANKKWFSSDSGFLSAKPRPN